MLTHPDPAHQFTVEVDTSEAGVGAMLLQQSEVDQKLLGGCFFSVVLTFKPDAGCLGLGSEPVPEPEHILAFSCILGAAIWPMEVRVREAWRISQHSALRLLRGATMGTRVQIGVSSGAELHATGTPGTPGVPACRVVVAPQLPGLNIR